MASPVKTRIDLLLVERGLVPSRERARALILAGRVLVNEQKIDKPGTTVASDAAIRLLGDDMPLRQPRRPQTPGALSTTGRSTSKAAPAST